MSSTQVRPSCSSDQEAKATDMIVWCRAPPCTPQVKQWDDRKTLRFEGMNAVRLDFSMCPINRNDQKFLRQKLASVSHFVLVNSAIKHPPPPPPLKKRGGAGKESNGCAYFSSNLPWGDFSSSMAAARLDVKAGKNLFQPLDMTTEEEPLQWWQKHQTVPVFMHS